ncbi:MAG: chromosomal replication initiator protein DnaA [Lachnospiraceae bacterium]|nr:chromosomal replication initiator protein DnaA [Lachnospiraceae bacterium]
MHQLEEKWESIKHFIKDEYELSPVSFNTWIKPLKFYEVNGNTVSVIIPSDQAHAKDYISKKYTTYFNVAISEMMEQDYEVTFLLEKDIDHSLSNEDNRFIYNMNVEKANLNPKYNFDTFVVGKNNNFAHSAALAVAESPGNLYNPLFIYGGAGLGKTHLMHSIGHFILEKNPEMKVLYVNSENFTNELIESIRSGNAASMSNLREKYRNIDLLLLDDIQFIIGKDSTQEEFFHTFNTLHNDGKQIVLTSDKPPKEFSALDERFRSRFEWGLIADIQAPDYETRMAILRKNLEAQNTNTPIDDEILKYIAENIHSNIRELEGALKKVMAGARLHSSTGITLESAENDLRDIIKPSQPKPVSAEIIMSVITEHFNISREDIMSSKRNSEIVLPRQIFMYLCREYLSIPYQQIGKYIGGKDHSTVMHGLDKIQKNIQEDSELAVKIETIKKKINAYHD